MNMHSPIQSSASPMAVLIPGIGFSYVEAVKFMKNDTGFQRYCRIAGLDSKSLYHSGSSADTSDSLSSQKLSYVVNCAICDLFKNSGIRMDYVVGYSMGIYAALYCGGICEFEDGLNILEKAFELIRSHCKSTSFAYEMAVVLGLTESEIHELLFSDVGESVEIAVFNGKRSAVIAGVREKIQACFQKAQSSGALSVKRIDTHYPYHTTLLKNIYLPFTQYLTAFTFSLPSHRVLSPIDGKEISVADVAEIVAKALCTPLHFDRVIQILVDDYHVRYCYDTTLTKSMRNLVRYINRHLHILGMNEEPS